MKVVSNDCLYDRIASILRRWGTLDSDIFFFLSCFSSDESFNPGEEDEEIAEEYVTLLKRSWMI